jgi:hypothetical protein
MKLWYKPGFSLATIALILFCCNPTIYAQLGNGTDSLTVNNVAATFNDLGFNFYSTTKRGMHVPKNTNNGTIFSSSLWVGGYVNNVMKISANTYRQSGSDFFPGPLDTVNAGTTTTEMTKWDAIWHVNKSEINDFLKNHIISASIANWPGNGNSGTRESKIQAPFIDVDHDGIYNPLKGDYPDIKGDEMLWWMNNDTGGQHPATRGYALGVEIQTSIYAFASNVDAINNTLFCEYKIINRSGNTIQNLYAGIFTDFDIGYAFDDYVGCLPKENVYFGYNGQPSDNNYGTNPPVQSVLFLKDSISRFLSYNKDASTINGNPGFPNPNQQDYFNYLTGLWKNDSCIKFGSDGIKGTQCTHFMFDGDITDTLKAWTEHNAGMKPGDRKCVGAIGPFRLKAGEVINVPIAYVFAQKQSGNTNTNFQLSKQYWPQVREFYSHNFSGIQNNPEACHQLKIFPNPANGIVNIEFGNASVENIVLYDNTGREIYRQGVSKEQRQDALDVSVLSDGVYTIMAESGNGNFVQKLVIAR